jgi:hypothetical protein
MLVFNEVDQELATLSQEELALGKKIRIIFMGGISGIAFGSRGVGGKTGDADFSFSVDTPQTVRAIMQKAVDRMVAKNPDKFELIPQAGNKPDPMNDQWDKHAEDAAKMALSRESGMVAWEGNYFTAVHGDWRMQLLSKMNRISEWRSRSTEFKERDQQDAKLFLQKARELVGLDQVLNMDHFVSWGELLGWDADKTGAAVRVSLKIVAGEDMPGVAQEIKDAVNKIKC